MKRKHAQIVAFPSVEEGVLEVLYSRADDGSVWRLENPKTNATWKQVPDLPDDQSWVRDYASFDRHERRG